MVVCLAFCLMIDVSVLFEEDIYIVYKMFIHRNKFIVLTVNEVELFTKPRNKNIHTCTKPTTISLLLMINNNTLTHTTKEL